MSVNQRSMRPAKRFPLPRRIRSLGLWLDASATRSLTFNGDTVSEWRDLSGRGRHFAQATEANQPDGANRSYNGLRVIDFDGTQTLLGNAATLSLARNVFGLTILCMCKFDTSGGVLVRLGNSSTGARAQLWQNLGAGVFNASGRRPDSALPQGATYASHLDGVVLTGVWDYENAAVSIAENGVLQNTNTSFHTPGRTDDTDSASGNTLLSGITGGPPTFADDFSGFIAELLVYRRVLSDAERTRLEQYLIAKWNPQPEPPPPPAPAGLSLWQAETREPVYHWSV